MATTNTNNPDSNDQSQIAISDETWRESGRPILDFMELRSHKRPKWCSNLQRTHPGLTQVWILETNPIVFWIAQLPMSTWNAPIFGQRCGEQFRGLGKRRSRMRTEEAR